MTKSITPNWYFHLIHSFILLSSLTNVVKAGIEKKCIESERQSLLSFKNGIIDKHNKLASWGNGSFELDCCNWSGVKCDINTNHIISLNLRGSSLLQPDYIFDEGKIGSSLLNLTQLTHLDLSSNHFNHTPIPEFVGYLTNLNYLNLSNNYFVGTVPVHLGNLSKLSILDLSRNFAVVVGIDNDFRWLTNLTSLKHLDLRSVKFSNGASDWANAINKLPRLQTLFLSYCRLPQPVLSSPNFSTILNQLDLDSNYLNSSIYPWLFTVGHSLVHLNLAYNEIRGPIPHEFGNMASLTYLDLSHSYFQGSIPDGLFKNMTSLAYLDLSSNQLNDSIPFASFKNMVSVSYLDLSSNQFEGSIPDDLFENMASLSYLDLSSNQFQGSIPNDIGNLTSLVHLDLHSNNFVVASPKSFENLCNLKSLSLYQNNMRGLLSDFVNSLPHCARNSLEYLNLASNKFIGSLPSFTMFPSLKGLDLSNNTMNGSIPHSFGQLSNLEYLVLGQNSLAGEVSEAHFSNLTKLRELNLSGNSLILNFKSDWVPPFQLDSILLRSCKLGPLFPNWLQTQNFSFLDLSSAQISDTIPRWFWTNLSPNLQFLDLSMNKIKGEIPNLRMVFNEKWLLILLNSNEFAGRVPPFLSQSTGLNLSGNKFYGVDFLCPNNSSPLLLLDLSSNQFSGQLPECWDHLSNLQVLNLANNSFFGHIPSSLANLTALHYLNLRDNQFSGEWLCWFNFTTMLVFDATNNHLSGTIPSCIGSQLPYLVHLNLKSNNFDGNLPSSLCKLEYIQVLDISSNNITGSIPSCINKLKALKHRSNSFQIYGVYFGMYLKSSYEYKLLYYYGEDMTTVWKGTEQSIKGKVLQLVRGIDLSSNHLIGIIPDEITELLDLISLNLSGNNLTGRIPDKMGQLLSLESLDLSRNRLFGPIPSNLSHISTLNTLNLSNNNLSGEIPTGTQLQSFHASSYQGNFYLCGAPLKKCFEEEVQDPSMNPIPVENRDEDGLIIRELFISMAAGFVVGFWGIFGSLILNRKWRHAYFNFVANIIDKLRCN